MNWLAELSAKPAKEKTASLDMSPTPIRTPHLDSLLAGMEQADNLGRSLAQDEMEKQALALGGFASKAMGAVKPMATKALGWAAKNPSGAAAVAGGALGAAGGAMMGGKGNRLGGALGGAALGAGAGYGVSKLPGMSQRMSGAASRMGSKMNSASVQKPAGLLMSPGQSSFDKIAFIKQAALGSQLMRMAGKHPMAALGAAGAAGGAILAPHDQNGGAHRMTGALIGAGAGLGAGAMGMKGMLQQRAGFARAGEQAAHAAQSMHPALPARGASAVPAHLPTPARVAPSAPHPTSKSMNFTPEQEARQAAFTKNVANQQDQLHQASHAARERAVALGPTMPGGTVPPSMKPMMGTVVGKRTA